MTVFVIGVSFGVMGLVVLAVARKGSGRTPDEPDYTHPPQIEILDAANEYNAVRCVLDWRIGY